ncbi:MAG TPA: class I SAM-dependent methyltransferase [Pyrinomonadaceae bacterium]|nr:class I SAM-dependent methyltransferase [Pyrinomonadaceae bacterium]
MDVRNYNRGAWDRQVEGGNEWTRPVGPEVIEAARRGEWSVLLTETKPTPREWFPAEMTGVEVLCLASGGGQQGPVLAAAGARVTVFDNSPAQLAQDRAVAGREGLELRTVEGDMADLSAFEGDSFDLVFNPASNLFAPDVRPVWREAFRVLRRGGALLAGFLNPSFFLFGTEGGEGDDGPRVKYALPYADTSDLTPEELERRTAESVPLEFGHSLTDQLGGQLDAGFRITGLYEDRHRGLPLSRYTPTYIATRAVKP